MKIAEKYPQFIYQEALIIVCGKQKAKIFSANNGFIEKIMEFEVETPTYSDKEGFFKTRNKSVGTIKAGSILKDIEKKTKKDFLKKLKKNLRKVSQERKNLLLYIFSPDYLKKEVEKIIEKTFKNPVFYSQEGNYTQEHAFKILEIIKNKITIKKEIKNEEVKKILKK